MILQLRGVAVTLGVMLACPHPLGGQQLAVVARESGTVVLVNIATGDAVATWRVGRMPHELALSSDSTRLLVPSYASDTLSTIHLAYGRVTHFSLGGHGALHGIATASLDSLTWITAENERVVLEVNIHTGRILAEWPTDADRSHMVVATPDGSTLYVASITSGTVSVIDRRTRRTTVLSAGAGTEGLALSRDGHEIWVSNRAANTLSVFSAATRRTVATIPSEGDYPVKLKIHPFDREVWVANNRSGTVAVFDRLTHRHLATIPVGERPLGIAFSADGAMAYVTRPGAGEIVEISVRGHRIVRRLRGPAGADGIAWLPPPP